nr:uncharacterized protein LOC108173473 [Malus domestica]
MRRRRATVPTSTLSPSVSNVGLIFTKGDLKEFSEEVGKYKKEPHLRVLLIRPTVCILKDHSQKHMECSGSASGEGVSSAMPTFGSSWVEHRNDLVTALNLFLSPSGFATFRAPAACLHVPISIFLINVLCLIDQRHPNHLFYLFIYFICTNEPLQMIINLEML